MRLDTFREHCLGLRGATEELPFGPDVLVFKVAGKMFALVNLDGPPTSAALKCDPEHALELRERYESVAPAYHFDKKHWIGVDLAGDASPEDIRGWTDDSYRLVVAGLTRRERAVLEQTPG